jgi:hypothetical protein
VQLNIRQGGAGPNGRLTRAKDGNSEHLNCELVIVGGRHAKRIIFVRYTVTGTKHDQAIEISRKAFKAILESARGIRPDDQSEAAKGARHLQSWGDFDHLRFVVRLGVEGPKDGYAAKNTIKEIITPDRQAWNKPEQIDRSGMSAQPAASAQSAAPPVGAITRPQWAQPEKK